ncbi:MAG: hypothetical protein ACJ746_18525 [Bryobacteraceae bacterium]
MRAIAMAMAVVCIIVFVSMPKEVLKKRWKETTDELKALRPYETPLKTLAWVLGS